MSYFDAVFLGLIQGLTEFLPVSSSGHLVLVEHILKVKLPGVVFELVVHFGTLVAVLIYFRRKILLLIRSIFDRSLASQRRMILFLVLGTLPAVAVALLFEEMVECAFSSPAMTSAMLIATGLLLLGAAASRRNGRAVGFGSSLLIGLAQALAILPGISRSGATISVGMLAGVRPLAAAEFSFLLSIPAIAGAIVFKIKDILTVDTSLVGQYVVGAMTAFFSGVLAVYLLLSVIKKGKFQYFGIYCLIAGVFGIIYFA
ncbi:MAG: undecaprenyl-diphosphate phosphatase [Candidatus Zixiibacteriota bacterium]|nr:MAG: undecaprenyl-diphosphate phosphatase [candidate division Zixibacteria bacterium]